MSAGLVCEGRLPKSVQSSREFHFGILQRFYDALLAERRELQTNRREESKEAPGAEKFEAALARAEQLKREIEGTVTKNKEMMERLRARMEKREKERNLADGS